MSRKMRKYQRICNAVNVMLLTILCFDGDATCYVA